MVESTQGNSTNSNGHETLDNQSDNNTNATPSTNQSSAGTSGGVQKIEPKIPVINNPPEGEILSKPRNRPRPRIRAKPGRGIEDPNCIIAGITQCWQEIQEFGEKYEEDKKEIIKHFNGLIEGEDDLGSILFSGYNEQNKFTSRMVFLDG